MNPKFVLLKLIIIQQNLSRCLRGRGWLLIAAVLLLPQALRAQEGAGNVLSGLDTRPVNPSCVAPERPQQVLAAETMVPFPNMKFDQVTDFDQAPNDDSKWYAAGRAGVIRSFENDENVDTAVVVLDMRSRLQTTSREDSQQWGITSFAFHPQFPTFPYMYVAYNTNVQAETRIRAVVARFETADGGLTFNLDSEVVLLTQSFDRPYHHLGNLAFGADGYLYIGFGDGNESNGGQNLNDWLGAILRIDVNGALPDTIPLDNPLVGTGRGKEELFAWGFRNPWRFTFDRETGELWVGDVGGSKWEEVNLVKKGGNYGWNILEGNQCLQSDVCRACSCTWRVKVPLPT